MVQGILPIVSLSVLNYYVYKCVQRRKMSIREKAKRLQFQAAKHVMSHEHTQSTMLFAIVAIFFVSHTIRFFLNVHEFFNLEMLKFTLEENCQIFNIWATAVASISHCIMTTNCSTNFLIYAYNSKMFRCMLKQSIVKYKMKLYTYFKSLPTFKNPFKNFRRESEISPITTKNAIFRSSEDNTIPTITILTTQHYHTNGILETTL